MDHPRLKALDRLAQENSHDPAIVAYVRHIRPFVVRDIKLELRLERRIAESRKLVALFSYENSADAATADIDGIAKGIAIKAKFPQQAAGALFHLATLNLATVHVAIAQSAPAKMFSAIFYLPLMLARFVFAKAAFAIAVRRAVH